MSDHTFTSHRCQACKMLLKFCLCAEIPNLEIKTKIAILMHGLEETKITNTSRLLKLAIPTTEIFLFGRLGVKEELQIPPDVTPLVLFPEMSAPVLDAEFCRKIKKPVYLIVPDGTWTQARKLIHRRENLHKVQRVRINREEPSQYKVRRSKHSAGLCTLEAVAEALSVLEGQNVKESLEKLLGLMVDRVLESRCIN